MQSPTTRRTLAVLTFGFFGSLLAFAVGARVGAALEGHVRDVTVVSAHARSFHEPGRAASAAIERAVTPSVTSASLAQSR